ncbi:hypothetical protein DDZ18_00310 [Marinicauda salina]|uniref:Protein ImuA n=2 Tax=Marinicauda salina TaxID=2135793 RepID=A0A2U2BVQ1_9PROT|nr:hypothetical protein DDZ18_00310 [Marinicauda salina]
MAGLHDLRPARYLDAPSAYAFAASWLAALPDDRAIVWVRAAGDPRLDFGAPCPDGLKRRGVDPARLLQVRARPGAEALWAMETALSAGALVLGEAGRDPAYDLTASRRLHRAARAAGVAALVVRAHDADGPSAALTRWTIRPELAPAAAWTGAGGLSGLGPIRVRAELERARGGPPRSFELEWSEDALRRSQPAPLADRSADRPRRRAG